MTWRIFGGDAARQRAVTYAAKRGWEVYELGKVGTPFARYGLDPWGRNSSDGIIYSFVAQENNSDAH